MIHMSTDIVYKEVLEMSTVLFRLVQDWERIMIRLFDNDWRLHLKTCQTLPVFFLFLRI